MYLAPLAYKDIGIFSKNLTVINFEPKRLSSVGGLKIKGRN